MFLKKIQKKNISLSIFLSIISSAQADNIYTNFLFYNSSPAYTFKIAPGHSRCIDPDRYYHKKTTIQPSRYPSSYWTNSIKKSCAATGSTFVTWYASIYQGGKQLCSVILEFDYLKFHDRWYKKDVWIVNAQQKYNGKSPHCTSIYIYDPYDIHDKTVLSTKNKIIITLV